MEEIATLGNSARVSISAHATDMYKGPLSQKKKRELRYAHVFAYIKSKPVGTRIQTKEFMEVANLKTPANADAFIKRMIKDKEIERIEITPRTFSYVVLRQEESGTVVVKGPDPKKMKYTVKEIEAMAMQFSWSHEHSNNDLRRFIECLKKGAMDGKSETRTTTESGDTSPRTDEAGNRSGTQ